MFVSICNRPKPRLRFLIITTTNNTATTATTTTEVEPRLGSKLTSDVVTTIQAIQGILAPAVMITGVGLLLLTFNARHSSLVNRIRLLNDERRRLQGKSDKTEKLREKNIDNQLGLLLPRVKYVRNGMLCHLLAVIFFVLTSFSIGLGYFSVPTNFTQLMINATFTAGMFLVVCGVAYQALELFISYRVIMVEVKER